MRPAEIKAARRGLGWTQAELAQRAGIHAKGVAYWENRSGDTARHAPDGAVPRIAAALRAAGVTVKGNRISLPISPD